MSLQRDKCNIDVCDNGLHKGGADIFCGSVDKYDKFFCFSVGQDRLNVRMQERFPAGDADGLNSKDRGFIKCCFDIFQGHVSCSGPSTVRANQPAFAGDLNDDFQWDSVMFHRRVRCVTHVKKGV